MATNIVRKGANRASHTARTNRAAQRTPLPAKGSTGTGNPSAEVIQQIVDEAKASVSDSAATVKASPKPKPTATEAKLETVPGYKKAKALAEFAVSHGWKADVTNPDNMLVLVEISKGTERIEASWVDGKVTEMNLPMYYGGGRDVRMRNVSAAKAHIDGSKPLSPVVGTTRRRRTVAADTTPVRSIPFSLEAADEEVIAALVNRKIVWKQARLQNMEDSGYEEAVVSCKPQQIKIVARPKDSKRCVNFVTEMGFRTVLLESLVSVS